MLVVTKNKRSQLLFKGPPDGGQVTDIVLEKPLVLTQEQTMVVVEEHEAILEGDLVCEVENDLTVSHGTALVLSLVCDKED